MSDRDITFIAEVTRLQHRSLATHSDGKGFNRAGIANNHNPMMMSENGQSARRPRLR